jgi:hypothetical protein
MDLKQLLNGGLALILVGCAATQDVSMTPPLDTAAPILSVTPALEATAILTETPPVIETTQEVTDSTPQPTAHPFPPALFEGFLFNHEPPDDCNLPCWQGLQVGQSTEEEVHQWFEAVLGSSPPLKDRSDYASNILEMFYTWQLRPEPDGMVGQLGIRFWLDRGSRRLQRIWFLWDPLIPNVNSPQQIIQELGPPTSWTLMVEGVRNARIESFMVYDSGIAFAHTFMAASIPVKNEAGESISAPIEFCLDRTDSWSTAVISGGKYTGGDPFYAYRPQTSIDVVTGIAFDDIIARALQNEHVCLTFDLIKSEK